MKRRPRFVNIFTVKFFLFELEEQEDDRFALLGETHTKQARAKV